jgi:hypothetical protein
VSDKVIITSVGYPIKRCPAKTEVHEIHVWGHPKESWGKTATPLNTFICDGGCTCKAKGEESEQ